MSTERQVAIWIAALVVLLILLWMFSGILMPFLVGIVLAYFLDPLADRLQQLGLGRTVAAVVILVAAVLALITLLLLLVPLLADQVGRFLAAMPGYIDRLQELLNGEVRQWVRRVAGGAVTMPDLKASVGPLFSQGASWFANMLGSLWAGGQALLSVFGLLVVTPVVAFYMLVDWNKAVSAVDSWVPPRHRDTVRGLAREIDAAIAGFLRGQALVCLLLGTFYAVGLTTAGLNFGLLIGMMAGIISFIPYVGTLVGFVVAVGVALAQFWPDWMMIGLIVGIFALGQFLEGNIITPKLVGKSVGLHPVWLMFALLAFGSLFGFVGLLVAVPLAAAVGVLTRFALRRYLSSSLYADVEAGSEGAP